jgi:hypothetical protein
MIESTLEIQTGQRIKFSEQQILDCCVECRWDKSDPCRGGIPIDLLKYIQQYGVMASVSYGKYMARQQDCKPSKQVVNIDDVVVLPNSAEYFLHILQAHTITASVDSRGLKDYSSGIIMSSSCSEPLTLDHAVNIIGYGVERNIQYWIVKNSYGTKWGEQGYFRIERGNNTCGIEQEGIYITHAFKISEPEVLYNLDDIYRDDSVPEYNYIHDIIVYCLCGITGICMLIIAYLIYRRYKH